MSARPELSRGRYLVRPSGTGSTSFDQDHSPSHAGADSSRLADNRPVDPTMAASPTLRPSPRSLARQAECGEPAQDPNIPASPPMVSLSWSPAINGERTILALRPSRRHSCDGLIAVGDHLRPRRHAGRIQQSGHRGQRYPPAHPRPVDPSADPGRPSNAVSTCVAATPIRRDAVGAIAKGRRRIRRRPFAFANCAEGLQVVANRHFTCFLHCCEFTPHSRQTVTPMPHT